MAQRNRLTHLVPALLVAIGALPALDGIAPVITVFDPVTAGPNIRIGTTNPVTALDLSNWAADIYFRSIASASWVSLDLSSAGQPTPKSAGIAITQVPVPTVGVWQYSTGAPGARSWTSISNVSETTALLLPLVDPLSLSSPDWGTCLRFVPSGSATPGAATLTLRAWDGSSGTAYGVASTVNVNGVTAPNGGSPTAFSAETRQISTTMVAGANSAPATIIISPSSLSLGSGETSSFEVSATDSDGDVVTWSAAFQSYTAQCNVQVTNTGENTAIIQVTAYNPITFNATETLDISANDGTASVFGVRSVSLFNLYPSVISGGLSARTAVLGGVVNLSLTGVDPDGSAGLLAWAVGSSAYLYASPTPSAGTGATFAFSVTASTLGIGTIPVTVTDEFGNPTTVYIPLTVIPVAPLNAPPDIISPFSGIAVAGVPWESVLTLEDPDGNTNLTLTAVEQESSSLPAGFTLSRVAERNTWRLRGTPPSAGTLNFEVTASDGMPNGEQSTSYALTVSDPAPVIASLGTLPVSTPGNPVYAAIAPGSAAGYSSLLAALAPIGPDIARGWWYSGGFRDIETQAPGTDSLGLDLKPRTGVFLASTVSLSANFTAKPFPMPFRITLPANSWTFFGVPALWDGIDTTTTHAWNDFRLDRDDGTVVTAGSDIIYVLAPANSTTPQEPFAYYPPPGAGYVQTSSMTTGTGYWVRNFSSQTYQMVRVAGTDNSLRIGNASLNLDVLVLRSNVVANVQKPPLPGAAVAPPAKAESAGSCGAGGLAGLLLAGLALIGLRPRRRI